MSTKIEDLPDNNNEMSSQILDELNDDAESEISNQVSKKVIIKKSNYDKTISILKDTVIVFAIVFGLSNTYIISAFSQLPYIKTLEPHSMMYNFIIALVAALLHFIVKYLEIL